MVCHRESAVYALVVVLYTQIGRIDIKERTRALMLLDHSCKVSIINLDTTQTLTHCLKECNGCVVRMRLTIAPRFWGVSPSNRGGLYPGAKTALKDVKPGDCTLYRIEVCLTEKTFVILVVERAAVGKGVQPRSQRF